MYKANLGGLGLRCFFSEASSFACRAWLTHTRTPIAEAVLILLLRCIHTGLNKAKSCYTSQAHSGIALRVPGACFAR